MGYRKAVVDHLYVVAISRRHLSNEIKKIDVLMMMDPFSIFVLLRFRLFFLPLVIFLW